MSLILTAPFWRAEPFTDAERKLLDTVLAAHAGSVSRSNISTVTVINAAAGSGDYCKALAAALMSIGGVHAPLAQTMEFLVDPKWESRLAYSLETGSKIPGWGNSFIKGAKDLLWERVEGPLRVVRPEMEARLSEITEVLHRAGKPIYPNPSAYTAAAALALGIPPGIAPFLFITGRLTGWTKLALNHV